MAAVAHDGLARAIRPVHSMFDGDTIFCLSTGRHVIPAGSAPGLRRTDTRPAISTRCSPRPPTASPLACTRAVIEAASLGGAPSYAICARAPSRRRDRCTGSPGVAFGTGAPVDSLDGASGTSSPRSKEATAS